MACRSPGSRKGRGLREPVKLRAESLAFGGDAVARGEDGRVVFVPLLAPGDRALVKLVEEKKGFARGEVLELLEAGPARVTAPCALFGSCGGCQWQHVGYAAQLAAKADVVARALRAEVARGAVLEPVLAAPAAYGYRRRARLAVRPHSGVVGFRARKSHEVIDVRACPALEPALERALGELRRVLVPALTRPCTLELLAGDGVHAALDVPCEGGARAAAEALVASGALAGLRFRDVLVGAAGVGLGDGAEGAADEFAQAQGAQNQVLRARVAEWARPAGARVLELFAGAGNLSEALLAAGPARLLAVEQSEAAVARARVRLGGGAGASTSTSTSARIEFEVASAESAVVRAGDFDVLVLDPPRVGALEVARGLADVAGLQRIVYVSCDPMTLARDVAAMTAGAWRLERAQAIDMMPQTFHVETVALLVRAGG